MLRKYEARGRTVLAYALTRRPRPARGPSTRRVPIGSPPVSGFVRVGRPALLPRGASGAAATRRFVVNRVGLDPERSRGPRARSTRRPHRRRHRWRRPAFPLRRLRGRDPSAPPSGDLRPQGAVSAGRAVPVSRLGLRESRSRAELALQGVQRSCIGKVDVGETPGHCSVSKRGARAHGCLSAAAGCAARTIRRWSAIRTTHTTRLAQPWRSASRS